MKRFLFAYSCMLVSACVLTDFQRGNIDSNKSSMTAADAGTREPDAGLKGATSDCSSCIADQCMDQLTSCGDNCSSISFPISPPMAAPASTTNFIACLKLNCDDACQVSWGCVNHYKWPEPAAPFTIDMQINDLISTSTHLSSVSVQACQASDPGCNPGSGLQANGTSDLTGHVMLTVQRSFAGFFLLNGDDTFMPGIGQWSQPTYWVSNTRSQPMVSWVVADALASAVKATVDRMQSHLVFQAFNCMPTRLMSNSMVNADAEDETITYTPPGANTSPVFYTTTGSVIDPTRTSTTAAGSSFGGVFNLPSQSVTIVGTHAGNEVSRAVMQMRPGYVGFLYLLPNTAL